MSKHLVIDADGHCNEPDSGLAKFMPKEIAHLAPNRVTDSSGYTHMMIEGRLAARRRWGGGADRGAVFADHIERSRPGRSSAGNVAHQLTARIGLPPRAASSQRE